ncbi:MAG: 30S ribosomal protein S18 [Spirochaetales bacterium]|nr:30S ribosomal protein S18 [Spirochaetales bacterium]
MPEKTEDKTLELQDAEKETKKNNDIQKNEKKSGTDKPVTSTRINRSDRPDRKDKDYDDKYHSGPRHKSFFRKKVCKFCTKKYKMDYKDVSVLRRFTSDRGKILPRRITGTCAKHQRQLSKTVKRARVLALLPFVTK